MRRLSLFGFYSGAVIIILITFITFANILGRSVFNWPIPGAIESIGLLMIFYLFLPLAKTQEMNKHIAVTFVVNRLPKKIEGGIKTFVLILSITIFAILSWRLGIEAIESITDREFIAGAINLPWYPSRIVAALGSFFMCCELAIELFKHITLKFKE